MKKIYLCLLLLVGSLAAHAQFERDTYYVNTSLTGLDMGYSGSEDFKLGANVAAGLFVADDIALIGEVGFDYKESSLNEFTAGLGGRYYIEQNGLFLGLGAKYLHANTNYNDLLVKAEVGYAFFLSRTITLEPAVYYQQSFKDHSNYSKVGLKVGFGFYF